MDSDREPKAAPRDIAPEPLRLPPESDGVDLSLIAENLKLTPWQRLLANDDALNFIESARTALKARHAAP